MWEKGDGERTWRGGLLRKRGSCGRVCVTEGEEEKVSGWYVWLASKEGERVGGG